MRAPRTVAVTGRSAFVVDRIWCVGRNYRAHAVEMGSDPDREPPFFFAKPPSALVIDGGPVRYPPRTSDLHHEVELVLALGAGGRNLTVEQALSCIVGCGVGVDLTRRDAQSRAKASGRPWALAKGFDDSAPCGELTPVTPSAVPTNGRIELWVNEDLRQGSDLAAMIWSAAEVVAELSRELQVRPGDLIFTGTPAGVGPLAVGDRVRGAIQGVGEVRFDVIAGEV